MPQPALLLVGPTGAGKSPLGDHIEAHGLCGRRCHHFDFGAHLREAALTPPPAFTPAEHACLEDVLARGALLENETFYLAEKILDRYLQRRRPGPGDLLILNGLPRHAGQAEAMARHVDVQGVIHLRASAATVLARLRLNTGGDRQGRQDDDETLARRKLAIYEARTEPLVAWYRERGVPVHRVEVGIDTPPAACASQVSL